MTENHLAQLIVWFDTYAEPYCQSENRTLAKTSKLKYEHTLHVVGEMDRLVYALGLPDDDCRIARVIALFHDIGRFEQFKRYNTLADRLSEDHSELGIRELQQHSALGDLDRETVLLIEDAIRAHNKLAIPPQYTEKSRFYSQLIRDADKLDILRVFIDVDKNDDREMLEKAYLELDESDTVNEAVYTYFERRELVPIHLLHSRNDMRLLILSWVFDLNFAYSLRRFRDRGDAAYLLNSLPDVPVVRRVRHVIQDVLSDPDRALAGRVA